MSNKYLIVVDMQHDFVDGTLGTPEATAIVERCCEKVRAFDGTLAFTQDTHDPDYLDTQEGRNLPVEHCIKGTDGWAILAPLAAVQRERDAPVFEKGAFGSLELAEWLQREHAAHPTDAIELVGLCTDICVVSNALIVKAALPEVPVSVDASCCAGVTPASHEAALATMKSCQIEIR